ncbi:integrase [Mycolicibacterium wolinskyi]
MTGIEPAYSAYAHLINTDDHAGSMAALGALAAPAYGGNVIQLHG